jgi:hypothetical protein
VGDSVRVSGKMGEGDAGQSATVGVRSSWRHRDINMGGVALNRYRHRNLCAGMFQDNGNVIRQDCGIGGPRTPI